MSARFGPRRNTITRARAAPLLLLLPRAVSAGDGFRSLSLFVGSKGEHNAESGEPADKQCKRFGTCDTSGSWHAQSAQDRVVKAIFDGKRDGYFVDLAANHPVIKSNTRALERDYGWRGLCIDGNEEFLMLLLKKRKCQVVGAIVSSDTDAEVQYRRWHGTGGGGSTGTWQHALSGIVGFDNSANLTEDGYARKQPKAKSAPGFKDIKAVTTRLEDVLQKHAAPSAIDYLSLDVEGAEEAVLRTFAFQSYTFYVVSIERPSAALKANIANHGYVFIAELPGNFGEELFVHSSVPGGVDAARKHARAVVRDAGARGYNPSG